MGVGKIEQWVKCWSHKEEIWVQIPNTHVKKQSWQSVDKEVKTGVSLGLWSNSSNLMENRSNEKERNSKEDT